MALMPTRGGVVAAVMSIAVVLAPAALADTGTRTFSTAGEHPFTVPPAVTSLDVTLTGGNGGSGNGGIPGGAGATVSATVAVTPGEQLYVEVAGDGVSGGMPTGGGAGGYGGGGGGGEVVAVFAGAPSGGGGGGASDLRTCGATSATCASLPSRLVVAAGGGGGGGTSNDSGATGGNGGNADLSGSPGQQNKGIAGGDPGQHGTASAGGPSGDPSMSSEDGGLGMGGDGEIGAFAGGGGGGGGGLYGGGGGAGGASTLSGSTVTASAGGGGGGGGSSGIPAGVSGVSHYQYIPTATGAEPAVTVTWTLPPPTVATGDATGLTSTSATITGTVNPNNSQLTDCHFNISPAPPAGSSVPCAQQIPVGDAPVAVSASLHGLSPSTAYTVTLIAANSVGPASGSPVAFQTLTPGGGGGGSPPAIRALSVARRIHLHLRNHHKPPRTITVTLSQPATVTFTFARQRHHRYIAAGALTLAEPAGTDRIAFSGRVNRGRRLKRGAYRVSAVAANAAGSSAAAHARFNLV